MGDCCLQAEDFDVEPRRISRISVETHYSLEVVSGRDTVDEHYDDKHRETWLPTERRFVVHRSLWARIAECLYS